MDKYVFINDDFVKRDKAFLHYSDLSIQRGYGCFDFFRTRDSVPVFIEKHLDRLFRSAEIMHMTIPLSREIVRTVIHELINKNGITDSGIRITVTGGYSPDGYLLTNPNLIVSENPFKELKTSTYKEGIRLAMYPYQRQLPEAKTIDYLMEIWLQPFISLQSADDVLYFRDGSITECPRSNFFIVTQNGEILTPGENILMGVTRERIIKAAAEQFDFREKNISPDEAMQASEAFISSTTKGVLPVTYINGKVIGSGKPGPVTEYLSGLLRDVVKS
jgi:D-alanine transaminase/branched-chain amino acid aminotransferase